MTAIIGLARALIRLMRHTKAKLVCCYEHKLASVIAETGYAPSNAREPSSVQSPSCLETSNISFYIQSIDYPELILRICTTMHCMISYDASKLSAMHFLH